MEGIDIYVLVVFFMACVIWAAIGRVKWLAWLVPPALILSFWIDLGTRLTPAKLLAPCFAAAVLTRAMVGAPLGILSEIPLWLILFGLSILLSSTFNYVNVLNYLGDSSINELHLFQSPMYRSMVQLLSYVMAGLFFLMGRMIGRQPNRVESFMKIYIGASTLLCFYGVYQVFAYYNNWPFRGIIYETGREGFGGVLLNNGAILPRVNSLANEPKQLAAFLLPSVILLLVVRMKGLPSWQGRLLGSWNLFLHCGVFVMTFATSGLGGLITILLVLPFLANKSGRLFKSLGLAIGAILIVLTMLFFRLSPNDHGRTYVDNILYERTYGIFEQERVEFVFSRYLLDHPVLVLTGMGAGNFNFWLMDVGRGVFPGGYLDVMSSGLLVVLADGGIVALLLFLWGVVRPVKESLRRLKVGNDGILQNDLVFASLVALFASLAIWPFVGVLNQVMVFGGIVAAQKYWSSENTSSRLQMNGSTDLNPSASI